MPTEILKCLPTLLLRDVDCGKLEVELESQDGLAAILHLKTTPINPQSLLLFVAKNIQSPNRTENLPFLLFDKNGPNSSKILFQKNVSR